MAVKCTINICNRIFSSFCNFSTREHFLKINTNRCQIISYNSGECTCGVTRIDTHNLTNFTGTTFFFLVSFCFCCCLFLSPSLPSPPSLHLSGARPELGGRKTEKKKKESEKKREREGDLISIPCWITVVESKTTECAGTGQRGWIQ